MACVWGWPMVNMLNRSARIAGASFRPARWHSYCRVAGANQHTSGKGFEMTQLVHHPAYLFILLIVLLSAAAGLGAIGLLRAIPLSEDARDNYNVVQAATLTLLALLIGFTLSMAVNRYDQRKNYEEEEANAIGTQYLRAELLGEPRAAQVKALLLHYLQLRVEYYKTRDASDLEIINGKTSDLQGQLWASVRETALAQPTPIAALVVAGMNDVINTQGYTQAAWSNRLPVSAWALMICIAFFSNLMQGYGARGETGRRILLFVLPITVSLSLTLISDIDSPRGGLIRVQPQNLISLQQSLRAN
jgi:cytochrome bd-type quinol oxidase subunit 2